MTVMPTASGDDDAKIRNLLARYCIALDLDDIDEWVSLFTPEATYEVYGRTFEGHEALARMMSAAPGGLHRGGPPVVEMQGADRARSRRTSSSSIAIPASSAARCTTTNSCAHRRAGGSPAVGVASSWLKA
jgi:SnoaL-like domain